MQSIERLPGRPDANALFKKNFTGIGELALRPLAIPSDIARLHDWFTRDYARFWSMQDKTRDEVEDFYRGLIGSGHGTAYMGLHDGNPAFLVESYDPGHDQVGEHYQVQPGDRGMHFLVAPAERPLPGFTFAVMRTILEFHFSDPLVQRVVVEPDVRNDKIHVLNRRAGFEYDRIIALREKDAHLAFCTREQYARAIAGETRS
ncbi:N-acetyltransferase [Phyllobacterium phragmitis]|uniref:N-acetyltransferase n=1 Tax=Phyllobacterium phragmitis TaxID=2670329 RepID=A0A2S9IKE3_9HYPH|nr:GNAT family N-acetyltransferase [Phyllobacterium phragmitis]PRD41003.1 N-acetyltransferase [Phyllobacterium phragmitis]